MSPYKNKNKKTSIFPNNSIMPDTQTRKYTFSLTYISLLVIPHLS